MNALAQPQTLHVGLRIRRPVARAHTGPYNPWSWPTAFSASDSELDCFLAIISGSNVVFVPLSSVKIIQQALCDSL